jgi:hypothetical protein
MWVRVGRWREHAPGRPGRGLVRYAAGARPQVVPLSGGPGDGSASLRPFAASGTPHVRSASPDQRGTGCSRIVGEDGAPPHVDRLLDDPEAPATFNRLVLDFLAERAAADGRT